MQNIMPFIEKRFNSRLRHFLSVLGECLKFKTTSSVPALSSVKRRQVGAAMVEILAGVSVLGTVTAVALTNNQEAEKFALKTHAQVTASAIQSAVALQQAKWAVNHRRRSDTALVFSSQGVPMGVDSNAEASQADCDLLWHELVSLPQAIGESSRYWSISPLGMQCRFAYHHEQLQPVYIEYHTQSGDVSYRL